MSMDRMQELMNMAHYLPKVGLPDVAQPAIEYVTQIKGQVDIMRATMTPEGHDVVLIAHCVPYILEVEAVAGYNPSMMMIDGRLPSGEYVRVMQHVSQLNIMAVIRKMTTPDEKPRQYGFKTNDDEG